jgi:hypothetical protein
MNETKKNLVKYQLRDGEKKRTQAAAIKITALQSRCEEPRLYLSDN